MNDTKINFPEQPTRLQVMMTINHSEEYYQKAARSIGLVPEMMKHDEICAFTALLKSVEADIIIQTAKEQDPYVFTDYVQRNIYDYILARANDPTL